MPNNYDDVADLRQKDVTELFGLLSNKQKNKFTSRVMKDIKAEIIQKAPETVERLNQTMVDASLRIARDRLTYIENTTNFFRKGMVDPDLTEIDAHLRDAGVDASALDETGKSTVEEEQARLKRAEKRAHFVVDCRKKVGAELRQNGFDPKLEDPVVRKLVDIVENNGLEVLFDDDAKDKESFIEQYARAASLICAQENLERLMHENVIYGDIMVDEIVKKIDKHVEYASTVAPLLGALAVTIPDDMEERLKTALCRAEFILGYAELVPYAEDEFDEGRTPPAKIEAMKTASVIWETLSNKEPGSLPSNPEEYTDDCVRGLANMVVPSSSAVPAQGYGEPEAGLVVA